MAKAQSVKIFTSDIIYKLVEAIEAYAKAEAGPVFSGELEILKVFGTEGKRQIVGGRVTAGVIKTGSEINIQRGENISGEGRIINVQEKKIDVAEAKENSECGLLVDSETKIRVGDKIKAL